MAAKLLPFLNYCKILRNLWPVLSGHHGKITERNKGKTPDGARRDARHHNRRHDNRK